MMPEHALAMFGNLTSKSGSYCAFWHVTDCAWLTAIAPIVHSTLIADARRNLFMVLLLLMGPAVRGGASTGSASAVVFVSALEASVPSPVSCADLSLAAQSRFHVRGPSERLVLELLPGDGGFVHQAA